MYRSDIDGLRALAVSLVVLFHAHLALCTGGFVGVDVFFVISGFLITGILCSHLETGRFSFLSFYERRIRRIFPVLFVVLLFTSAACFVVLLSMQFPYFGRYLVASGFFLTNIAIFRGQEEYFAPNSATNPLLHLWSLSIEEQFYLCYPLFLFVLWSKARKFLTPALIFTAVGSLIAASLTVRHDTSAAFYLAQYRIWELLAGAILNRLFEKTSPHKEVANFLGLVGIVLIFFAAFFYDDKTQFPGLSAVPPVLGAALLIYSGKAPTLIAKFLSLPPIVWLGKISYGLYLWHWPLFVLSPMVFPGGTSVAWRLGLVALSVLLAAISHRLVELPFGNNGFKIPRAKIFAAAGTMVLVTSVYGLLSLTIDSPVARWQSAGEPDARLFEEGILYRLQYTNPGSTKQKTALWGDSFAQALLTQFQARMKSQNRDSAYVVAPACVPFAGLYFVGQGQTVKDRCNSIRYQQSLLQDDTITEVVLYAYWERYIVGKMPAHFRHIEWQLCAENHCAESYEEREALFLKHAKKALAEFKAHGKRVVIIGPVPGPGFSNRRAAKLWLRFGIPMPDFKASSLGDGYWNLVRTFEKLEKETGVVVRYPHKVLCGEKCMTEKDGEPLYADDHHLNSAGSGYLWDVLRMNDLLFAPRDISSVPEK